MSSLTSLTKQFLRFQSINNNNYKRILFCQLNNNWFGKRFLFSNEVLGIDRYVEVRHRIGTQFANMKDKFFERMSEYTNSESNMIFTEDLKNTLYLVENNENELNLLNKMIKKFSSQNESLRFGTFVFGPIVMRVCHHLGNYDLAVSLLKDPELKDFFNQLSSITIALDLLFEHKKYEEVIDLFDYVLNNIPLENKYPRDSILLVIASTYKINTPQSFDKALQLFKNVRENEAIMTRKTVCLFSALALNQNQPNIALEILSSVPQTSYITVRNLRLWALSELKRFDDVITVLKLMLNRDSPPEAGREALLEETWNRIKTAINNTDDKELMNQLSQIERGLIEGNYIQTTSLDTLLTTPVMPFVHQKQQNFGFRNTNTRSFPVRHMNQNYATNSLKSRQGLKDFDSE